VYLFEKNVTDVVRIVYARSFTILIETVRRSTGTKPEIILTTTVRMSIYGPSTLFHPMVSHVVVQILN